MPIVIMIFDDFARDIPQANQDLLRTWGTSHCWRGLCPPSKKIKKVEPRRLQPLNPRISVKYRNPLPLKGTFMADGKTWFYRLLDFRYPKKTSVNLAWKELVFGGVLPSSKVPCMADQNEQIHIHYHFAGHPESVETGIDTPNIIVESGSKT